MGKQSRVKSAEWEAAPVPCLSSGHADLDRAFRLAMGDMLGNVGPFKDGLLKEKAPVLLAGMGYDTPWTRDAAINVWNGFGLVAPQVSKNTLLSVLEASQGQVKIGGQYWDAIIWATGAWAYYLYTGDREFLTLAYSATLASLDFFEKNEQDPGSGLFRGPACYGDGVAAYPDIYAQAGGSSSILDWPSYHPQLASKPGYGLPMKALSTNCLYLNAYQLMPQMERELKRPVQSTWLGKASRLRAAMQKAFWNPLSRRFRYLVDAFGGSEVQESLGFCFAALLGLADAAQKKSLLQSFTITPGGVPCLWPCFKRYRKGRGGFGRHSGAVWPFIQGFWCELLSQAGRAEALGEMVFKWAGQACRDQQFFEMYHPVNGRPYGGLQEDKGRGIRLWESCPRQTWSATAFLRAVLTGILGCQFEAGGLRLRPRLPEELKGLELRGLRYRNGRLDLAVERAGSSSGSKLWVNGRKRVGNFVFARELKNN